MRVALYPMNEIYPELSPKVRIPKIVSEFLYPHFEKEGFRILKSGLTIKRECGDLVHEVEIFKNKRNCSGGVCTFEIWVSIYSPVYKKWYKTIFGEKLLNTKLIATKVELLPNSKIDPIECDFDFELYDNGKLVDEIITSINGSIHPFFNDHQTVDNVIETIKSEREYHKISTLLDLCELKGDKIKAKALIKWFRFGTLFKNYSHINESYKLRLSRFKNGYNNTLKSVSAKKTASTGRARRTPFS
jgi:hypothetical protein